MTAPSAPARPEGSHLPHVLAALYALAVVYASLQPFGPWLAPPAGSVFWLWSPHPFRTTRFDIVLNIIAYVPLGSFVALVPRRAHPARRAVLGALAGCVLAFAMESLQAWIPTRDASVADLASNTCGAALGALLAARLARHAGAKRRLASLRAAWALPGTLGDVGLALLALWLVAQCNPGIRLFASTWDPTRGAVAAGDVHDVAGTVVNALESMLQFAGIGLFVALLVRRRALVGIAIGALIAATFAGKGLAAVAMLRPAPWDSWLRPDVALGMGIGALLLFVVLRLPRAAQVVASAVLLLLSLGVPLLAADPDTAQLPLAFFNWRYGQLLNFNGVTHTVLLLWPLAATAWLFALAGKPDWGAGSLER